jgi:hypothetical protein
VTTPYQPPLRIRLGRALGYWLVPQGLRDAERRIRAALRTRRLLWAHRHLLTPNAELHGRHGGERCFVIGNGPSLARQDLSHLAGEITFCVNSFWKHPIVERWAPTYYCLADPDFFDGSEPNRRFFADLRQACPSSTLLLPLQAHRLVAEQGLVPASHVRYVAFAGQLRDGLRAVPDLTRAVPGVINVTLLAILTALYAGCSRIYLLGLDHDWLAHRGVAGHFHGGAVVENHETAAFTDLAQMKYKKVMQAQLDLWNSYEALGAMAERMGARILNATDGGFLDVFPRARYEDVVAATTAPPAARLRST